MTAVCRVISDRLATVKKYGDIRDSKNHIKISMADIETAWFPSTARIWLNRSPLGVSILIFGPLSRRPSRAEFQNLLLTRLGRIQLGNDSIVGQYHDAIGNLQDLVDIARSQNNGVVRL